MSWHTDALFVSFGVAWRCYEPQKPGAKRNVSAGQIGALVRDLARAKPSNTDSAGMFPVKRTGRRVA